MPLCSCTGRLGLRRDEVGTCEVQVFNPAAPMSEEDLRRLFGRFARSEHGESSLGDGSGLGLSIVASIMRLHGGEATTEAVPRGIRFRLVFRSSDPEASRPKS